VILCSRDKRLEMKTTTMTEPTSFEKFRELTRKLLAVPKKEVDQEIKKYERRKKRRKQRSK